MSRLMSTFGRSRYPNSYRRSARRLLTTQLFCNLTLPPVERYARADALAEAHFLRPGHSAKSR